MPEQPAEQRAPRTAPRPPLGSGLQPCPQCGYPISDVAGSKAAICPNRGF